MNWEREDRGSSPWSIENVETVESRIWSEKIEQLSTSSMKETIRAKSRDFRGFRISKEVPPCEMVAAVVANIGSDFWGRDKGEF